MSGPLRCRSLHEGIGSSHGPTFRTQSAANPLCNDATRCTSRDPAGIRSSAEIPSQADRRIYDVICCQSKLTIISRALEVGCYTCVLMKQRHTNILQFKESYCVGKDNFYNICSQIGLKSMMYVLIRGMWCSSTTQVAQGWTSVGSTGLHLAQSVPQCHLWSCVNISRSVPAGPAVILGHRSLSRRRRSATAGPSDRMEQNGVNVWVWSSGCLGVPLFLLAPTSSDVGSPLDR
ncbi:hypothetical protein LSAT2_016739 [Lamellibrachia satsuma]|nr:hypothetical protein LSAT2_016739 [Lamellibrachia satsuma]